MRQRGPPVKNSARSGLEQAHAAELAFQSSALHAIVQMEEERSGLLGNHGEKNRSEDPELPDFRSHFGPSTRFSELTAIFYWFGESAIFVQLVWRFPRQRLSLPVRPIRNILLLEMRHRKVWGSILWRNRCARMRTPKKFEENGRGADKLEQEHDQWVRTHGQLEEKVKTLQREKDKHEGICEEDDLAIDEGRVQADETTVPRQVLEDLHNKNQQGMSVARRSDKMDTRSSK